MTEIRGILSIRAIEGRDLIVCDKGGTSDPYCIVSVGNLNKRTKTIKKTLSPKWNDEPFIFPIDQNTPPEIMFEVFDWNKVYKHKRMGCVKVVFKDLLDGKEIDKWMPLTPLKEKDEVSGEIHVTLQFSKQDSKPNNQDEEEPELFTAIRNSDLPKVEALVGDPKIDINMADKYGYTPLHAACCLFSDVDDQILSCLLNHKDIDVKKENDEKNTPLHYFCAKFRSPNCADAFEIFIAKGANVNAQNHLGETPLHKAIFNNSVRILMVDLLIKAGADVNKVNSLGETPLHYAVRLGREDLVSSLLRGGTDLSIRGNKENKTPKELAVEENHQGMIYLLDRAQELFEWLESIGMEKYKGIFIREEMYKDVLPDLDEKALDRMGISTTGHRLKLLKAAKAIEKVVVKKPPETPNQDESAEDTEPEKNSVRTIEEELNKMKFINNSGTWILHHSELEFTVKLGSGTSGTVYKGLYKGKQVAIKMLKTEQSQKELEEFKKEFQVMSTIVSPYIVFFFGACLEPKLCMVMEICTRGSLYHVLNDSQLELGWDRILSFATEMVKGVDCLHSYVPQVLHRDFKSLNILVTEQWHAKVADFGQARFNTETQRETLTKMRGTFAYCAPEVYFGEQFSTKSDVFSIGIVLWELVVRCITGEYQRPYQEYPNLHFDFQIIIQTAKKGLRPTLPEGTPEKYANLIRMCWDHEAAKRPSCKEVLQRLEEIEADWKASGNWPSKCIQSQN